MCVNDLGTIVSYFHLLSPFRVYLSLIVSPSIYTVASEIRKISLIMMSKLQSCYALTLTRFLGSNSPICLIFIILLFINVTQIIVPVKLIQNIGSLCATLAQL